jgi:signal transduction histidine kinase
MTRPPASLIRRLMEAVAEMAVVAVADEQAKRDQEVDGLRELLKHREDFLRMTIHELRRPLTLANGHLSMIQDGTYGEVPLDIRHALDQMVAAYQEMEMLLDDLASVLRLEDGAEVLTVGPLRLDEVISAAIEAMSAEAARKGGTRINAEIEDPEVELLGDGKRLRIAIANLIANAIKYGPAGSQVTVRGSRRSRGVVIAVSDEGSGIDPAEADHIFEAHRRGRNPGAPGGLGLGLAIVRRIAELHGGHVTMESPPGRGATFTFYSPGLNRDHVPGSG